MALLTERQIIHDNIALGIYETKETNEGTSIEGIIMSGRDEVTLCPNEKTSLSGTQSELMIQLPSIQFSCNGY